MDSNLIDGNKIINSLRSKTQEGNGGDWKKESGKK